MFRVADFKALAARAVEALIEREEDINRLNRFPVADFDTGTNMLATSRIVLCLMPDADDLPFNIVRKKINESGEFLGYSGQMIANFLAGFLEAAGGESDLSREELASALCAGLARAARSYAEPEKGTAIDLFDAALADRAVLDNPKWLVRLWRNLFCGDVARDAGALGVRIITEALCSGPVTTEEKGEIKSKIPQLLDGLEPAALDPVIHFRKGRSFQVVTDSSSDLTRAQMEAWGVSLIPLRVVHHGKVYGDGVNIDQDDFYHILQNDPMPPTTSLAPKEVYLKAYRGLLNRAESVLSIHLSSALSGTFHNALQAIAQLRKGAVEAVDSRSISLGLGFLVREAAAMADRGTPLVEAKKKLEELASAGRVLITVKSLRYLKLGGRLRGGAYLMARMLRIRPILSLVEGKVAVVGKALGQKRVNRTIMARLARDMSGRVPRMIAVVTAADAAMREYLARELQERFSPRQMMIGSVGPVIGVHAGPGAWGIFYIL